MSFHDLPSLGKTFFLFMLFSLICVAVSLTGFTYHKKSKLTSFFLIFCAIQTAMILILYTADVKTYSKGYTPILELEWYADKNLLISIVPLIFIVTIISVIAVKEYKYRKKLITYASIRGAIDHLPTGLCFFYENGRVMLVNHLMYTMCFKIVGRDLQNANLYWDILQNGETLKGVERIKYGEHPILRFEDGSVWTFSRIKVNDFYQLSAIETTELYNLTIELEENNENLKQLNKRLKKYGEDVDALTRSRERLETKERIHGQLGQALLASRRYLTESDIDEAPLDIWQRSIWLLTKEAQLSENENPLDVLIHFVEKAGIDIEIKGDFPKEKNVLDLFLYAGAEALTNAVKHADAQKIFILIEETDSLYSVSFSNDGEMPRTTVKEGGGLSSLRRRVESSGGTMEINYKQGFILKITMKKGENESDQRINS